MCEYACGCVCVCVGVSLRLCECEFARTYTRFVYRQTQASTRAVYYTDTVCDVIDAACAETNVQVVSYVRYEKKNLAEN